ncbi:SRPBCC family protein [Amorphus coralli]|uniref:SRPBCC family protein n=1 Tax=Amorphus coralli TaxID=340680 RepID=UPI000374711F|nr:carbon monoxide dehydrogenase subunit G [Amorphus coralli]
MEMSGEYRIPASREAVWEALNDPEILKACIPGCKSLDKASDTEMSAVVQAKVGPVKATFNGHVTLQNLNPPTSYTIAGEGKGGVAGFAKGSADVNLAEHEGETLLTYRATAQIGGKLAQLGSRLVDSTAKKYADEFFSCLSQKVGSAPPAGGSEAASDRKPAAAAAAPAASPAPAAARAEPAPSAIKPIPAPTAEHHRSTLGEIEHEVEEAYHEAEERLEVEAGKGTLGGPWMWGLIAFAVVIVLLLIFN